MVLGWYPSSHSHAVLFAVATAFAGQLLQAPSPGAALYLPVPAQQPDPHSQGTQQPQRCPLPATHRHHHTWRVALRCMLLLRARRSPDSQAVQLPVDPGSYPLSQTQSVILPDGDTRFGSLPHTPKAAAGVSCPKTSTSAATTATFVAAGILETPRHEAPRQCRDGVWGDPS